MALPSILWEWKIQKNVCEKEWKWGPQLWTCPRARDCMGLAGLENELNVYDTLKAKELLNSNSQNISYRNF